MSAMHFATLWETVADTVPDTTALVHGDERLTWREYDDQASRLAGLLAAHGVGPGSGVGLYLYNANEYPVAQFAAYKLRAVAVNVNYRYLDDELVYLLADAEAQALVYHSSLADRVARVRDRLTTVKVLVEVDDGGPGLDGAVRWAEALAHEPAPRVERSEDDLYLIYTGGTTGMPKGVASTQRAQMLNLYHLSMVQGLAFSEDAVYLHHMPMFHSMGANAALSAAAFGTEAAVIPAFEPGAFMAAVAKHGVTETVLVPTMIAMILRHADYAPDRLSSLKRIGYGGMAMPHALLAKLQESSPDIELLQGYGMTEACPTLTFLTADDHRKGEDKRHSVGRPLPGIDVGVFDDDGNRLPAGEVGEVCARGGNIMTGYWNDEAATAKVFRDGWYRTGDLGRFDDDGYLYLVDRVDDMIVTGGENVYSIEVENALTTYPGVVQVAVVGVPDDVWGKRVHGIVVLAPDAADTTEEQLAAHAKKSIAGYKVPKTWELRTEPLPVSGAGKPLKRELRP